MFILANASLVHIYKSYWTDESKFLRRWRLNLFQFLPGQLKRTLGLIVPPSKKLRRKWLSSLKSFTATISLLHSWDAQIFTLEEISELRLAIDRLIILWPTQRNWEQKEASVTPKSHNLWFEVVPQLSYLGRFFHLMEDPIALLHKLDKLIDAVYCHIRNYQFWEECKQKQE